MPFSAKNIEEKPYNMCLDCRYIGKSCDGPNFLAMSMERWSEWCRLRKEYLGWTNAHIAEVSEISKASVDRALGGSSKDIRISTMAAITRVLVNGTWGQYPCTMAAELEATAPDLSERCRILEDQHADDRAKIDHLKQQNADQSALIKEYMQFFRRKNTVIAILGVLLGIAICVIIAALLIDSANPNAGFFWVK